MTRRRNFTYLAAAFLLSLVACGDDSPSSPSTPGSPGGSTGPAPTAPTIDSPVAGSNLTSSQPLLTVRNATGGSGALTYRFEVATDERFANLVASTEGVSQGGDGKTSWQVFPSLEPGKEYLWRARATASGQPGPYSEAANFAVIAGFSGGGGSEGLLVFDPLTNGTSVGLDVRGGTFTPRGWQVVSAADFIRYQVPTLTSGFVEFTVTNIREPNPVPGKRLLLTMWDPTKGVYRENPYRVHIQKMDKNTVTFWDVRLRWLSKGGEYNTGVSFFDFQANIVYPWRIEWGRYPGVRDYQVRVFLEGVQIMERNYADEYHPKTHWIELGNEEREETLEEAIFSNVKIGPR